MPDDKIVDYNGWQIQRFEGYQIGYRSDRMHSSRKIKGYSLSHPEVGGDVKLTKTIREAKHWIDNYN